MDIPCTTALPSTMQGGPYQRFFQDPEIQRILHVRGYDLPGLTFNPELPAGISSISQDDDVAGHDYDDRWVGPGSRDWGQHRHHLGEDDMTEVSDHHHHHSHRVYGDDDRGGEHYHHEYSYTEDYSDDRDEGRRVLYHDDAVDPVEGKLKEEELGLTVTSGRWKRTDKGVYYKPPNGWNVCNDDIVSTRFATALRTHESILL